jgi:hypothetical protein
MNVLYLKILEKNGYRFCEDTLRKQFKQNGNLVLAKSWRVKRFRKKRKNKIGQA